MLAGVLFGLSLAARVALIGAYHFDGLYSQDPYAYLDHARQFVRLLSAGEALGKLYYPIGFPLMGAFGLMIGGDSAASVQWVVVIAGSASCALAGLITLEIALRIGYPARYGLIGGAIAGIVVSLTPQHLQSSVVIMSDIPALMWGLMAVYGALVYGRNGRGTWLVLTAGTLSLTALCRFQYALFAVPVGLYVLSVWGGRIRWRQALVALSFGVLVYSPQVIVNARDPSIVTENRILWAPANLTAQTFTTSDGQIAVAEPNWLYYLLPIRSPYFASIWLLPLAVIGCFRLRWHPGVLVLLLGWAGVQYGFLAGLPIQNIRYALAGFVPIPILIGLGAIWIISRALLRNTGVMIVGVLLVLGLSALSSSADSLMRGFVGNKNRELATLQWLQTQVPEPYVTVYGLDMIPAMQYYTHFRTVQVFYETPETVARRIASDLPAYLLLNLDATETQWAGRAPALIYHWLRDHTGLTEVGTINGYTLFRIDVPFP